MRLEESSDLSCDLYDPTDQSKSQNFGSYTTVKFVNADVKN